MKHIHNAYLDEAERNAQPNAEVRDQLANELFAKPARKRWFAFSLPALAMMTAAVALIIVMKPNEEFAMNSVDSTSGMSDLEDSASISSEKGAYSRSMPVALYDGDDLVNGVRGSYCDDQKCVDTVGPSELVEGMDFANVSGTLTLVLQDPAADVVVDLLAPDGTRFRCASTLTWDSKTEILIDVCDGDEAILSILIHYEQGGDVSYVYPIK